MDKKAPTFRGPQIIKTHPELPKDAIKLPSKLKRKKKFIEKVAKY
jgi:hypothetical protein